MPEAQLHCWLQVQSFKFQDLLEGFQRALEAFSRIDRQTIYVKDFLYLGIRADVILREFDENTLE